MAEGASNRAIAARMFLSERAVERSVTAIFDELGLTAARHTHRRVFAVLAYLRTGPDQATVPAGGTVAWILLRDL